MILSMALVLAGIPPLALVAATAAGLFALVLLVRKPLFILILAGVLMFAAGLLLSTDRRPVVIHPRDTAPHTVVRVERDGVETLTVVEAPPAPPRSRAARNREQSRPSTRAALLAAAGIALAAGATLKATTRWSRTRRS